MALTPIGGDINAQKLNDNFSYLDQRFAALDRQEYNVKHYGAAGDGIVDDTAAIQATIDSAPDGGVIFVPPGTYKVSKNSALSDFPNGDQPCLLIRGKKNLLILAYGATFKVDTHAQGILEIELSERVTVEGAVFQGRGTFPAIDSTGRGEKGTSDGGYNTVGFWGYYKNNSYDTTDRWPKFGNGFIGNVSYGILINRGCKDITIRRCKASGFNYVGFAVGHQGNYHPTALNYPESTNILFDNCNGSGNYSAGFHTMDCDGVTLDNCDGHDNGHPDASVTHNFVDPGYGITARAINQKPTKNLTVVNSRFRGNKRKGIDGHAVIGFSAIGNRVIESMACGIFANYYSNGVTYDVQILNNYIKNCGYHAAAQGAIQANNVASGTLQPSNLDISHNTVVDCASSGGYNAIISAATFKRLTMIGNKVIGMDARATQNHYAYAIGSTRLDSEMLVMTGNMVDISDPKLVRGMQIYYVMQGTVSDNVVRLLHDSVVYGIYLNGNDLVNCTGNVAEIGANGIALSLGGTNGAVANNSSKGGTV